MTKTVWRIALDAGVRASSVRMYLSGRLVSGFAQRRIEAAMHAGVA